MSDFLSESIKYDQKGGKWPLKFLPGRNSNYETKIEKEFWNLAVEKKIILATPGI